MIASLQRAFDEASKLTAEEQEVLASRLLSELGSNEEETVIPGGLLSRMAFEALAEHRAGLTEELDPDRL